MSEGVRGLMTATPSSGKLWEELISSGGDVRHCTRAVLLGLMGIGGEGAGEKYDNFLKGTEQDGFQFFTALFIQ